jgi:predicted ester cyclase
MKATHQGELLGIPPTGKQITNAGINIYRLVNGKIARNGSGPTI